MGTGQEMCVVAGAIQQMFASRSGGSEYTMTTAGEGEAGKRRGWATRGVEGGERANGTSGGGVSGWEAFITLALGGHPKSLSVNVPVACVSWLGETKPMA